MLHPRAPGFSRSNLQVFQTLIFMLSLIHKVGSCLANVFSQKCLVVTANLLLWTDIAVECAWLFSLTS